MRKLFPCLGIATVVLLAMPPSASAAEYETFVGCDDLAESPIPSHECQVGDFPGAFFESDVDTEVEVCVEFPTAAVFCSEEEPAEGGVLYVFSIFAEQEGNYLASWYVEGLEVGTWAFRLNTPAPPPPPVTTTAAPPTPVIAVLPPSPSSACLQARRRVHKLVIQLRKADDPKQKRKIAGKVRKARAAKRHLC